MRLLGPSSKALLCFLAAICAQRLDAQTIPPACDVSSPLKLSQISGPSSCAVLQRAFALGRMRTNKESAVAFHQAIALAHEDKESFLEGEAHRGMGMLLMRESQYASAKDELLTARKQFEQLSATHELGQIDFELARQAYFTSDRKQAAELYDRSISEFTAAGGERQVLRVELDKETLAPNTPEKLAYVRILEQTARNLGDEEALGRVLHAEGDLIFTNGNYAAALASYQQSLTALERADAEEDLATLLVSMGRLMRAQGHADAALPYYERSLQIERKFGNRENMVEVLNAEAVAYHALEQDARALALYREALAIARADHSARYERFELGNLAGQYRFMKRFQEAIPLLKQVIAQEDSAYLLGYRYEALGDCYYHLHAYREALDAVNQSIELRAKDKNQEGLLGSLYIRA